MLEALRDYRVVDQLASDDHLAILWRASVKGQEIEGVDTLQCDMHGQVLETLFSCGRSQRISAGLLTRTGEPIVAKLARPEPAKT